MIVTTKTGDQGTTEIQSGRISKADPLLEVLGDLDELSADCLVFASLTPAYRLVMEALVQDLSAGCAELAGYGEGRFCQRIERLELEMKEMLKDYLQKALRDNRVDMIFFMLTNIMTESSEILCCGQNAKQIVIEAFDLPEDSEEIILKKVVSRKKQVVPLLMSTLQH